MSGRWREAASPTGRSWSWSVVADDIVYAISIDHGLVARYDVAADAWDELPDQGLDEHEMTLGASGVGDPLFVLTQEAEAEDGVATPSRLSGRTTRRPTPGPG